MIKVVKNKKIIMLGTISILLIGLLLSFSFSSKYNSINKETKKLENIQNKNLIGVYINGEISNAFPNTSNYIPRVECSNDIKGYITWEENKWILKTEETDSATVRCNVFFTSGTQNLKDAIMTNNNSIIINDASTLTNQPGKAISGENEKFLVKTPDDYDSNSYIFRGNIDNNYVVFANKCWKIVRITGNNAIKLILQNNNGTDCSVYNSAGQSAFNNAPGVFNTATGVGFMYGEPNPSGANDNEKYLNAQANTYDSTILTFLKGWYDNVFTASDKSKLADVIWCNDKSKTTNIGYGGTVWVGFSARERIVNGVPTLVCPDAGSDNKLSKFTASDTTNGNGALNGYKIGLLTADEVAYAGGKNYTTNNNFYLANNTRYSLLSPLGFDTSYKSAGIYSIQGNNELQYTLSYYVGNMYVRPSIALSSTVTYYLNGTGTPGTITNPYIVI